MVPVEGAAAMADNNSRRQHNTHAQADAGCSTTTSIPSHIAVMSCLSMEEKQSSDTAKASLVTSSSSSSSSSSSRCERLESKERKSDGDSRRSSSQQPQAGILDADGTWNTTNKPNKFPSASNPATISAAAHVQDVKAKGKAREHSDPPPASALSSASTSPPSAPAPAPASLRLAFLDKVAAPAAPRSQAISPYGSSHELYTAAKKYRLQASQPNWSPPATASASPAVASSSSSSISKSPDDSGTNKPVSRALSTEVLSSDTAKLEDEHSKLPEEDTRLLREPGLPHFPPPNPSETPNPSDMGSARPAYTRAQRRPSPLEMPAAKRRRSNGAPFRAVKVEDTEDGTTFLIRSKTPALESIDSTSRTQSSYSSVPGSTPEISQRPSPSQASEVHATTANTYRAASPAQSIDLSSSVADEDCACFVEELSIPTLRVPRNLPRPAIVQGMDLTELEVDSSLKDIPLPYILDNIIIKGPSLLSTVVESSIALPTTSHLASLPSSGPAIPSSVAVRTPTRLFEVAAPPECVLAVSSDETSKIMFLPAHGLLLAASCKSFAGIAKPPRSDVQAFEEGEDIIHILPVVHIHLPNSSAFSRLIPFFYTQEAGSLLASLLPLQHLPALSLAAAQTSPSLLASSLAKLDQQTLVEYVHLNHSMWRTTVALGAGKDELWKVLQASWAALITALSIQHTATLIKLEEKEA